MGNIAVPLIIRRDFAPRRQGTAMGIYTAALNIGSFLTSVAMAPLAAVTGWRLALAAVAVLAVAAVVVWVLAVGPRTAFLVEAGDGGDSTDLSLNTSTGGNGGDVGTAGTGGRAGTISGVPVPSPKPGTRGSRTAIPGQGGKGKTPGQPGRFILG